MFPNNVRTGGDRPAYYVSYVVVFYVETTEYESNKPATLYTITLHIIS